MKNLITITIFVLFLNIIPGVAQPNAVEFIKKVQTYQDSIKTTYDEDTGKRQLGSFDFNKYMQMFNALKIKDSHDVFDYFYIGNRVFGNPFIYIKKPDFDLIRHFKATMKNPEDESEGMSLMQMLNSILMGSVIPQNTENLSPSERAQYFLNDSTLSKNTEWMSLQQKVLNFLTDSTNKACNNVIPEDTKEGYMQYLFFHEYGEQFALAGHSLQKKRTIVCSETEVEEIAKRCAGMKCDKNVPQEECCECDSIALAETLRTGVSPIIEMREDGCFITLYEKDTSGLFKETFQVMRSQPYKVILRDKKEIFSISTYYMMSF